VAGDLPAAVFEDLIEMVISNLQSQH